MTDRETNQEILKARRAQDDRRFVLRSRDPQLAPKLAPMVAALELELADCGWHPWDDVRAAMLCSSPEATVKTADELLRRAVNGGLVERRGRFSPAHDERAVQLADWPEE